MQLFLVSILNRTCPEKPCFLNTFGFGGPMKAQTLLAALILMTSVIATADRSHGPCGLRGSIDDRIAECNTGRPGPWWLVTRTDLSHEVWQDDKTKTLWSELIESNLPLEDHERLCTHSTTFEARGRITSPHWDLPNADDYKASEDGISILPPGLEGKVDYQVVTTQRPTRASMKPGVLIEIREQPLKGERDEIKDLIYPSTHRFITRCVLRQKKI
jgi:hypothetical protein